MLRVPLVSAALARAGRRKFLLELPASLQFPQRGVKCSCFQLQGTDIYSSRCHCQPFQKQEIPTSPGITFFLLLVFSLQAFSLITFYLSLSVTFPPFGPFEATNIWFTPTPHEISLQPPFPPCKSANGCEEFWMGSSLPQPAALPSRKRRAQPVSC